MTLTARLERVDGSFDGVRAETLSALERIDSRLASHLKLVEGQVLHSKMATAKTGIIGAGICLVTVGAAVSLIWGRRRGPLVRSGQVR